MRCEIPLTNCVFRKKRGAVSLPVRKIAQTLCFRVCHRIKAAQTLFDKPLQNKPFSAFNRVIGFLFYSKGGENKKVELSVNYVLKILPKASGKRRWEWLTGQCKPRFYAPMGKATLKTLLIYLLKKLMKRRGALMPFFASIVPENSRISRTFPPWRGAE